MINRNMKVIASSVVAAVLSSSTVFAAGFEKSIPWSGKYAGQGNAAVSSATGAEALYFNPAGLAGSKGTEISINVSPTFSKFSGPVATASTSVDGKQTTSPIFGALASYAINEKLAVGIGSFVSAGARAEYEAAPTSAPLTITLNPKTDLYAIEHSAGVGYEVMPGLKLGASLRYTQVTATLVSASMLSATLIGETTFSNMKASQFGGFRLGASYDGGSWGVGANFRSAVNFSATGTGTIRTESAAAPGTITTRDLTSPTIASNLPAQLAIGGHYNASESLRLAAEYVLTNYQKVAALDIGGSLPAALGGSALPDLNLGFRNQTNVRLGASYALNSNWTLRGGYVYTSQVTPAELARPTLTPPGVAHSITAGFGTGLTANMDLNVAGEYTTTKGTGTGNTAAQTKAGEFAASGYVFHTGVSYRF